MILSRRTGVSVFCCYSQKDEDLACELKMHLWVLHRQGLINGWYNRPIESNKEEAKGALLQIYEARIIFLLISQDFTTSDYWQGPEMDLMLAIHEGGYVRILPIILRPVERNDTLLKKF